LRERINPEGALSHAPRGEGEALSPIAAVSVTTLLLLVCGQTALAEPAQCLMCRVTYLFGNCPATGINKPPENGIAFTGTVTAAKPIHCGHQITVRLTRSSSRSLPATIAIDVAQCTAWVGAIGDTINAAVFETPSETGAYTARRDCGGAK
jgi:hypothetical protein